MNGKDERISANKEVFKDQQLQCEITDDYKQMIDDMIQNEIEDHVHYVTLDYIRSRFIGI
jgi:hypothetical protein